METSKEIWFEAEVYRKIKLSPPIREILTSKADRAVMAVTIERDSWRVAFAFAIWS